MQTACEHRLTAMETTCAQHAARLAGVEATITTVKDGALRLLIGIVLSGGAAMAHLLLGRAGH